MATMLSQELVEAQEANDIQTEGLKINIMSHSNHFDSSYPLLFRFS